MAAAAVVAALTAPTVAFGNARRDAPTGSLAALKAAETPYIARLLGSNEVPAGSGDPDGLGAAAVSFAEDPASDTMTQVCWDLSYSNIVAPTAAHIHRGATGVNGPVVVDFGAPGAASHTGCVSVAKAIGDEILATPAGFYVNVHNSAHPTGALRGQLSKGAEPAGSPHFLPTPLRAYDSRIAPATKLAANATRTISLAEARDLSGAVSVAVPPGAIAAIVTLTATDTDAPGSFLKLYNAASVEPPTSSINWSAAGASVAVTTQVAVNAAGEVKVTAGPGGSHFLIDVIGYLY